MAAIDIEVTHGRVNATFGGRDYATLPPAQDLLRTRCPGPTGSDLAFSSGLAAGTVPVRALSRPTVTIHLTKGTSVSASGYTWRTRPNLTIVLRRTRITEQLVPSSAFET